MIDKLERWQVAFREGYARTYLVRDIVLLREILINRQEELCQKSVAAPISLCEADVCIVGQCSPWAIMAKERHGLETVVGVQTWYNWMMRRVQSCLDEYNVRCYGKTIADWSAGFTQGERPISVVDMIDFVNNTSIGDMCRLLVEEITLFLTRRNQAV